MINSCFAVTAVEATTSTRGYLQMFVRMTCCATFASVSISVCRYHPRLAWQNIGWFVHGLHDIVFGGSSHRCLFFFQFSRYTTMAYKLVVHRSTHVTKRLPLTYTHPFRGEGGPHSKSYTLTFSKRERAFCTLTDFTTSAPHGCRKW